MISFRQLAAALLLSAVLSAPFALNPASGDSTQAPIMRPASSAGFTLPPTDVVPMSDATRDALSKAMALTASGQRDEALEIYRKLASDDPDQGIPALARFLYATATDDEKQQFLKTLSGETQDVSLLARARGLAALQHCDEAIRLLEDAPDHTLAEGMYLARLLQNSGREKERIDALLHAMRSAPDDATRGQYANAILRQHPVDFADDVDRFVEVTQDALLAAKPDREAAITVIDPILIEMQARPGYFDRRERLEQLGREGNPTAIWLATRALEREESHPEALKYVSSAGYTKAPPALKSLLVHEQADLLRIAGKYTKAQKLLEALAKENPEFSSQLLLEASGAALANKDYHEVLRLIDSMPAADEASEGRLVAINGLIAASELGDLPKIIDIYAKHADARRRDDVSLFNKTIFDRVLDTDQHLELDRLIREQFAKNPNTKAELWLLDSEAAEQARRMPDRIEAVYNYVKARPDDVYAIELLATLVVPLAKDLNGLDSAAISAPDGEVERINYLAEQSLKELIKLRPYEPSAIATLTNYYAGRGEMEKSAAVTSDLAREAKNPAIIENAAYAMARSGHPEEALRLYDEALRMDPGNVGVQMNRAACLTRLNRSDEAEAYYRELLENGYKGRSWHFHELLDRLWKIAEEKNMTEELAKYLDRTVRGLPDDRRRQAIGDTAALFAHYHHMDQAESLYRCLLAESSTTGDRIDVYMRLIDASIRSEDYKRALGVIAETRGEDLDVKSDVDLTMVESEALTMTGQWEEAVARLIALAGKYPDDQSAMIGVFTAAGICSDSDDSKRAAELYQRFLDSPTTSFHHRRLAETALAQLKQQQESTSPETVTSEN